MKVRIPKQCLHAGILSSVLFVAVVVFCAVSTLSNRGDEVTAISAATVACDALLWLSFGCVALLTEVYRTRFVTNWMPLMHSYLGKLLFHLAMFIELNVIAERSDFPIALHALSMLLLGPAALFGVQHKRFGMEIDAKTLADLGGDERAGSWSSTDEEAGGGGGNG
jgi:hypothetical protein